MKKLLLALLAVSTLAFAADVTLYISGQTLSDGTSNGTLEIYMVNEQPVLGFQIDILFDQLEGTGTPALIEASGGTAGEAAWMVSSNPTGTVLGFSLMGTSIPVGEGVLTNVAWDGDQQDLWGYLDLAVTNIAGPGGTALTYEIGDPFLNTDETIVNEFKLDNNYPNPFNPTTKIDFQVAQPGDVTLVVYDILGHEITTLVSGFHTPAQYTVTWDGTNASGNQVSSGIYYYKMISGNFVDTKKMMYVK